MNKQNKYKQKIFILNKAWQKIKKGLRLIKEAFPNDNDIDYFWWKVNKANDKMQSYIFKKLESKYIKEEFQKMIKKLKEDSDG